MKVTHICLNGPVTDGWSYQDNLLPKYQKKLGYEVSVIASKFIRNKKGNIVKDSKDVYYNENEIKTIRIKNKFNTNLNTKLKIYHGLYEKIEAENPDILFVHGVQFLNIIDIVKYLKKHPEVIVYVDNHADFSNSASNWFSKRILHGIIWRKCARMIEPHTKKFYGVLPSRVEFLKKVYKLPEEKVELLLMGADDEKVVAAQGKKNIGRIREHHNIKPEDFLIVTGGKIDNAKKQILLLMKAIKEINKDNIKLLIFGSIIEELKEEFMSLVDDEKIKYIGWIKSDESYNYFATADLAIFPGRHSVLWEQVVGQGIPMIVKYWEGTTHIDLEGNCDFLYENSMKELKVKIEYLINNDKVYKNMKKIAQKKGLKNFSYLNIAMKSIEFNETNIKMNKIKSNLEV